MQRKSNPLLLCNTIMLSVVAISLAEAFKSDNYNIFDSKRGDFQSKSFRIPGLITLKSGAIIAIADIRHNHCGDAPAHIDLGVSLSYDNGTTWKDQKQITSQPGSASTMDAAILQDSQTGKIFVITTTFPENYGFSQSQKGNGFYNFNNSRYLALFDGSGTSGQKGQGNIFLAADNGTIIDTKGAKQNITLNDDFMIVDADGKPQCSVFLPSCSHKIFGTGYLGIIESSDDGKTWSKLKLINSIKDGWMKFFGAGPGRGHQIPTGKYAGRLVFPVYYTNTHGFQSSAVIYSDDHGVTWKRGESPNDRRYPGETSQTLKTGNQLTESQVVSQPNGNLWLFCRNTGAGGNWQVKIATSLDGGQTWLPDVYSDTNLWETYCQLTVANYPTQIEGKDALVFANPAYTKGGRKDGAVRIGLISEDGKHATGETKYKIDWKYKKTFQPGEYWYSCLTVAPNGNIGVLFETTCDATTFTIFNVEYVQQGDQQ